MEIQKFTDNFAGYPLFLFAKRLKDRQTSDDQNLTPAVL